MMSYYRQLDTLPVTRKQTNLAEIVPVPKGNIHGTNHIFIANQPLSHTYKNRKRKYTPSG